jgi:tetratricopeptide (TPR) repeat protein
VERYPQLDAAGCACAVSASGLSLIVPIPKTGAPGLVFETWDSKDSIYATLQSKFSRYFMQKSARQSHVPIKACVLLLAKTLCLAMFSGNLCAQCAPGQPDSSQIRQLFAEHNWAEVVRLTAPLPLRSPDLNFEYGLALAHLAQWPAARAALIAGSRQCPQQKRFPIELAGIAFERKRYPEAAAWIEKGLRLDPLDNYANNFAGTVYLLMGNLNAALKYWNRIGKPYVAALRFDPQLRVHRLILDRSFVFSPAAVLHEADLAATEARLNGLGIFPAYSIVLSAQPDGNFDAEFHAIERDGLGNSRLQALVSTFAGAAYETIYPSYFNIGGNAANLQTLLRWDKQKRRVWLSLSAPLFDLPQRRAEISADARNENWVIRQSFTGPAPALGSLNLERQSLTGSVTSLVGGRLQWSTGAGLSHRSYRNVVDGTALTPALIASGFELKPLASIEDKLLDVPERRFTLTAGAKAELARLWRDSQPSSPNHFGKLQASAVAHWFPEAQGDTWEAQQRVRTGRIFASAPFDELFMLGVERDNDLWMRGHIGTRDGRKGSSPLGNSYILSNTDFFRCIYSNGLFSIKLGPLLDIGRMGAPTAGLSNGRWLFDTGAEAKLTVLGTSVVLTYGRDLRTGSNAFYGTAAQ